MGAQLYELWKDGIDVFTAFDATKDNTAILTQGTADPVPTDADPVPGVGTSKFYMSVPSKMDSLFGIW